MFITGDHITFAINLLPTLTHFLPFTCLLCAWESQPLRNISPVPLVLWLATGSAIGGTGWRRREWEKRDVGVSPCAHPRPLCLRGVRGREGERGPLLPIREETAWDEEMDRDFGQLSYLASRGEATLGSELITNNQDGLKIREGEESNTDGDWILWSSTIVRPSKHVLLNVCSSCLGHRSKIGTLRLC